MSLVHSYSKSYSIFNFYEVLDLTVFFIILQSFQMIAYLQMLLSRGIFTEIDINRLSNNLLSLIPRLNIHWFLIHICLRVSTLLIHIHFMIIHLIFFFQQNMMIIILLIDILILLLFLSLNARSISYDILVGLEYFSLFAYFPVLSTSSPLSFFHWI
jgi:hypothetical protein